MARHRRSGDAELLHSNAQSTNLRRLSFLHRDDDGLCAQAVAHALQIAAAAHGTDRFQHGLQLLNGFGLGAYIIGEIAVGEEKVRIC